MKYLIVGLGNPGAKYAETRHNIGFKVVEALAKELGGSFSTQKVAEKAEVKYKGRILMLVKPTTYQQVFARNFFLLQVIINRLSRKIHVSRWFHKDQYSTFVLNLRFFGHFLC